MLKRIEAVKKMVNIIQSLLMMNAEKLIRLIVAFWYYDPLRIRDQSQARGKILTALSRIVVTCGSRIWFRNDYVYSSIKNLPYGERKKLLEEGYIVKKMDIIKFAQQHQNLINNQLVGAENQMDVIRRIWKGPLHRFLFGRLFFSVVLITTWVLIYDRTFLLDMTVEEFEVEGELDRARVVDTYNQVRNNEIHIEQIQDPRLQDNVYKIENYYQERGYKKLVTKGLIAGAGIAFLVMNFDTTRVTEFINMLKN